MAIGASGKYLDWVKGDGLITVEGYAREGLTDKQIASKMGISIATFYDWIKKFPDFSDAIKKGKAPVDTIVENALLKRALGYEYEEVTTEAFTEGIDENGKPIEKSRHVRRVTKHVPADVAAAIFWLKNRRPDRWREKREEQVTVTGADYSLLDGVAMAAKRRGNGDDSQGTETAAAPSQPNSA